MLHRDPEPAELPNEKRARIPRRHVLAAGVSSAVLLFIIILAVNRCNRETGAGDAMAVTEPPERLEPAPVVLAVRPKPKDFRPDTYRPKQREGKTSGSIDLGSFSAGRDLVHVDDARVWWESDNDSGDTEDDHSMHRAMEAPLRRLIELVDRAGGTLKVQDAYRGSGVHNPRSLHKEGRALDLTCDELGLEELARLCWMAGFDWVYHEASSRGGSHVHVSIRRDHDSGPAPD